MSRTAAKYIVRRASITSRGLHLGAVSMLREWPRDWNQNAHAANVQPFSCMCSTTAVYDVRGVPTFLALKDGTAFQLQRRIVSLRVPHQPLCVTTVLTPRFEYPPPPARLITAGRIACCSLTPLAQVHTTLGLRQTSKNDLFALRRSILLW